MAWELSLQEKSVRSMLPSKELYLESTKPKFKVWGFFMVIFVLHLCAGPGAMEARTAPCLLMDI